MLAIAKRGSENAVFKVPSESRVKVMASADEQERPDMEEEESDNAQGVGCRASRSYRGIRSNIGSSQSGRVHYWHNSMMIQFAQIIH